MKSFDVLVRHTAATRLVDVTVNATIKKSQEALRLKGEAPMASYLMRPFDLPLLSILGALIKLFQSQLDKRDRRLVLFTSEF